MTRFINLKGGIMIVDENSVKNEDLNSFFKDSNSSDLRVSDGLNNSNDSSLKSSIEEPSESRKSSRLRRVEKRKLQGRTEGNYWIHRIDYEKIADLSEKQILAAMPKNSKPIDDIQKDDRILLLTKLNNSSRIEFFAYTQVDEVYEDEETLYGGYYKSKKKLKLKGIKYLSKPVATKDVVSKLETVEKSKTSIIFKPGKYHQISENDYRVIRKKTFLVKEFPEYLDEFNRPLDEFIRETIGSLNSFFISRRKNISHKKFLQVLKEVLEGYGIKKTIEELDEFSLENLEKDAELDGSSKDSSNAAEDVESDDLNTEDLEIINNFTQKINEIDSLEGEDSINSSNGDVISDNVETVPRISSSENALESKISNNEEITLDHWKNNTLENHISDEEKYVLPEKRHRIKSGEPRFWIHRIDCRVIKDLNERKIISAESKNSKLIKDLNKSDKILLLTKLNNSSKIEFFAYTQVDEIYYDEEILYDGYYKSNKKLKLKSIEYFSEPIATNDMANKLSFVKNKEKSANDFKAEYKIIPEWDFATIYEAADLVNIYPDYLIEYNASLKEFMLTTIKFLIDLLKVYYNQNLILIKKFIRIFKEVLSAYGIYRTNGELETFYSRNIYELKLRHIPSRDPSEFVPLYMPSGKSRNYSFISLD